MSRSSMSHGTPPGGNTFRVVNAVSDLLRDVDELAALLIVAGMRNTG
jgi:hypothetical protein